MSTPGNDSADRPDGTGPAPLFDPYARTEPLPAATGTMTEPGSDHAGRVSGVAQTAAERTSDVAHAAADKASTAAGKASGAAHTAADKASGAAHSAADRASGAAHTVADRFASVRSSMTTKSTKPAAVNSDEPSVGDLVKDASTHMSTLIRSEIELAKTELSSTVKKAAIGGALFVVAAVIILYSLTFGLIAAGEGIHTSGLPRWASYLIVFAALVLIAAIAALVGVMLLKRMQKPERTMTTVKDTAAWAKSRNKSD